MLLHSSVRLQKLIFTCMSVSTVHSLLHRGNAVVFLSPLIEAVVVV